MKYFNYFRYWLNNLSTMALDYTKAGFITFFKPLLSGESKNEILEVLEEF